MKCDRCKKTTRFILVCVKRRITVGMGSQVVEEEWCPECLGTTFPAGMFQEAD